MESHLILSHALWAKRHLQVAFFAVCMGIAGLIFYYIGISMGWLYVREP